MEIQDAYKLIYQSMLGLGHILENHTVAKNYKIGDDTLARLLSSNIELLTSRQAF